MSDYKEGVTASAMAILAGAGKRVAEILAPAPKWLTTVIERVEAGKKERGRPKGKLQHDDERYLIEMGRLLETGEAGKVHRAAKIVVAQNPELTPQTILKGSAIRRLCDAFKKDEALYRFLGRENAPAHSEKAAR